MRDRMPGGLDDLRAAVIGREKVTENGCTMPGMGVHVRLERRKEIARKLRDLEAAGDVTIVERSANDIDELVDIIATSIGWTGARGGTRSASILSALGQVLDALSCAASTTSIQKRIVAYRKGGSWASDQNAREAPSQMSVCAWRATVMSWCV